MGNVPQPRSIIPQEKCKYDSFKITNYDEEFPTITGSRFNRRHKQPTVRSRRKEEFGTRTQLEGKMKTGEERRGWTEGTARKKKEGEYWTEQKPESWRRRQENGAKCWKEKKRAQIQVESRNKGERWKEEDERRRTHSWTQPKRQEKGKDEEGSRTTTEHVDDETKNKQKEEQELKEEDRLRICREMEEEHIRHAIHSCDIATISDSRIHKPRKKHNLDNRDLMKHYLKYRRRNEIKFQSLP